MLSGMRHEFSSRSVVEGIRTRIWPLHCFDGDAQFSVLFFSDKYGKGIQNGDTILGPGRKILCVLGFGNTRHLELCPTPLTRSQEDVRATLRQISKFESYAKISI